MVICLPPIRAGKMTLSLCCTDVGSTLDCLSFFPWKIGREKSGKIWEIPSWERFGIVGPHFFSRALLPLQIYVSYCTIHRIICFISLSIPRRFLKPDAVFLLLRRRWIFRSLCFFSQLTRVSMAEMSAKLSGRNNKYRESKLSLAL